MKTFYLKVVASNKVFFEGMAQSLTVPIYDGSIGILADHENTFAVVESGEISIKTEKGEKIYGFVGDGFVEIIDGTATVVVMSAELPEDIDATRAKMAMERAKEQLAHEQTYREHEHAVASLARATHRLELLEKYKK